MSGFSTSTNAHLIRSQIWSQDLKQFFDDELMGMKYVKMITDFPDGDVINIPSIGQAEVFDYVEGQPVKYSAMDTGNFQFSINQYKSAGTTITNRMLQDSMYAQRLMSEFVPKQSRALAKAMEVDILRVMPTGQTAANNNIINDGWHRWVARGTNETLSINDFIQANVSLNLANVPQDNRVAIVDVSCEPALAQIANLTNISNNPAWEGIVREGMTTGTRFRFNIYGFDVYISQNLHRVGAETLNSRSVAQGVANLFFSASQDALPIVGLVRQPPKVESEYNKDFQREEFITTCRYGFSLFRPENTVVVLSDTDQMFV